MLLYVTIVLSTLILRDMQQGGGDDKNGPKRRIWRRLALGEYFFFLFLMLSNAFICYYSIIYEICNREGGDDENGPKRRQLSPR